jgi:membrane fusion protein (multidrug efflux system)
MKTSHSFKLTAAAALLASVLLTGCNQANSSTAATTAEAVIAVPVEASVTRKRGQRQR